VFLIFHDVDNVHSPNKSKVHNKNVTYNQNPLEHLIPTLL